MADDIAQWLNGLGLGQYAQAFAENDVRLDVLQDLSDADLRELGVSLGDRRRILRAITDSTEGSSADPPTYTTSESLHSAEAERRQASSAGDRIAAEGYFQHAEHYFRQMTAAGRDTGERENHTQPKPAFVEDQPQPDLGGN